MKPRDVVVCLLWQAAPGCTCRVHNVFASAVQQYDSRVLTGRRSVAYALLSNNEWRGVEATFGHGSAVGFRVGVRVGFAREN